MKYNKKLLTAIQIGDNISVQKLLSQKTDDILPDQADDIFFKEAIIHSQFETATILLEHGICPENKYLRLALYFTVCSNDSKNTSKLLDHIKPLSEQQNYENMILHLAAECGHLEIVSLLFEREVKVSTPDSIGRTALHLAAEHSKKNMVEFLLENGANPNAKDHQGRTALYYVSHRNYKELKLSHDKEIIDILNSLQANPESKAGNDDGASWVGKTSKRSCPKPSPARQ